MTSAGNLAVESDASSARTTVDYRAGAVRPVDADAVARAHTSGAARGCRGTRVFSRLCVWYGLRANAIHSTTKFGLPASPLPVVWRAAVESAAQPASSYAPAPCAPKARCPLRGTAPSYRLAPSVAMDRRTPPPPPADCRARRYAAARSPCPPASFHLCVMRATAVEPVVSSIRHACAPCGGVHRRAWRRSCACSRWIAAHAARLRAGPPPRRGAVRACCAFVYNARIPFEHGAVVPAYMPAFEHDALRACRVE